MAEGELDLSAVISKLMNDKSVAELVERLKTNAENDNGAAADSHEKELSEAQNTMLQSKSDVEKIPSEVMEKLPEVMAAVAPLMKNGTLKGLGGSKETDKRNRLLAALKPYMNESRSGMIDSIMALSKLTGIRDVFQGNK